MRVAGLVQKLFKVAQGADQEIRITSMQSVAVAQTELIGVETTRTGRMVIGGTGIIANGIAPDTAIPTTTAKLALFNAEPDGGRSYFVDRVYFGLGSGTAAAGASLFLAVSNGKLATPVTVMATGYGVGPSSGLVKHKSGSLFGTAVTLPTNTVWHAVIGSFQLAAANVGQGDQPYYCEGGIGIPPGYALGFSILSGAGTTPLYYVGARWNELEVDLET